MNGKKLLAISGSPHKNGITSQMLQCSVKAAGENGWEVHWIDLYDKDIAYCRGCRSCLKSGICVQKDDIQEIAGLIKECDVVALAAPVYWANIPAAVKNMFDRLLGTAMEETTTFPRPKLPGKTYMLYTACNTRFPFSSIFGQSGGAVRAVREFFKTAGLKCGGRFVCAGTAGKKQLPEKLIHKIEKSWNQ